MPVMNRRTLLRSAGVCISLPLLDAMCPIGLHAEQKAAALRAKRILMFSNPLGLYAPYFFPEKAGKDYEPTRYLQPLQPYRNELTVFSGLSHVGYPATHDTQYALLTGAPAERVKFNDVRNTISLDQEVASQLGNETRFPYLSLGGGINLTGGALSWNRQGVMVPSEGRATQVFKQLFIDGTPDEVARELQRIKTGNSILDGVRGQAKSLADTLGPADRDRIDLLLTSIREAEKRLQQDENWVQKPKPKPGVKPFMDRSCQTKWASVASTQKLRQRPTPQ